MRAHHRCDHRTVVVVVIPNSKAMEKVAEGRDDHMVVSLSGSD